MKLVLAIVNNDDSTLASSALTEAGFSVTKLSTTGGFLMAGNTTFIIGTDDEKVDEVLDVIKKHSKKRTQMLPSSDRNSRRSSRRGYIMDSHCVCSRLSS